MLYRLSETTSLKDAVWDRFKDEYSKARTGRTLAVADEPEGLAAGSFRSPMAESRSADEPDRLSAVDFAEERLSRLVPGRAREGAHHHRTGSRVSWDFASPR